ncbi:hypothetical protein GIB67_031698 [Kingdonia uniflora]|uniref:Reverse transcriptase zinc-binding domain-containing protein n=1 Tax=Kingdonia uniflora TaxID=39325 RepID=A0A7J7NJZ1_9MAGN|nr:hypothetical protein GIB67_031698 [Kingdonia uniflora]
MWSGIRSLYSDAVNKSIWMLGNGDKVDAWRGNWTGLGALKDLPNLAHIRWKDMQCVKAAYEQIRSKLNPVLWKNYLWRSNNSPRHSNLAWRMLHNAIPKDATVQVGVFRLLLNADLVALR